MKTRYTPLVKIKKSDLEKCEREVKQANTDLQNAQTSLSEAYGALEVIEVPQHGKIQEMLKARTVMQAQRKVIDDKKLWLYETQQRLDFALVKLKKSHIEFEKFKYLEVEEIKKALKENAKKESKELDEIAVITHNKGQK